MMAVAIARSRSLLSIPQSIVTMEDERETTAYSSLVAPRRRGAFGRPSREDEEEDSGLVAPDASSAPADSSFDMMYDAPIIDDEDALATGLFDLDEEEDVLDLDLEPKSSAPDTESEDEESEKEEAEEEETEPSPATAAVLPTNDNTEPPAQESEDESESEKEPITIESAVQRTDELFAGIEDMAAVTVKDILRALRDEFQLQEDIPKDVKLAVRERLIELIQLRQQTEEEPQSETDTFEGDEESEDEASEGDEDDDDEEEFDHTRKPKNTRRTPAPRGNARAARKAKTSAMRIQADQLRKRRMEELKVRNEEMQSIQDKKDQERTEQIAAKFETNTDELRMQRLEQRLGLLQKLDQKRVTIMVHQQLDKKLIGESETNASVVTPAELDEESSDEEMELELVGANKNKSSSLQRLCLQPSAVSMLNIMDKPQRVAKQILERQLKPNKKRSNTLLASSPGKSLNARAALKNKLRSKKIKMGNAWLARELGYKTEAEHLKDCMLVEERKRQRALKVEEERVKLNEFRRERMMADGMDEEEELQAEQDMKDEDPTAAGDDDDYSSDMNEHIDDEEDEELAMAEELERERSNQLEDGSDEFGVAVEDHSKPVDAEEALLQEEGTKNLVDAEDDAIPFPDGSQSDDEEAQLETQRPFLASEATTASVTQPDKSTEATTTAATDLEQVDATNSDSVSETATTQEANNEDSPSEEDNDSEPKPVAAVADKPRGPRNSAWQAMLKKEAEQLKKMKKRSGGDWVEDEADEEEEDEVAGLEDFGFTVKKKKDADDEDVADDMDEDDLKHVVDDLSDDEGDEDAGEKARKLMEQKEEKERHKEMMRRMREGYDGRRGGIAFGGAGARGLHRFDQLVAADNREDAKRLGLLNDDELDSDDEDGEKKGGDDEEEDEAALLDKMLKDRFLHRSSTEVMEETFSDDENEDTENNSQNGRSGDQEEEDEKEQDRLAKRFAKRARMQRLLEMHGHEEEFSQGRFLEEDDMLKEELSQLKVC